MANHAESTGKGDAKKYWQQAYDTLSGMKERGMFIPSGDLQFLETLRGKAK